MEHSPRSTPRFTESVISLFSSHPLLLPLLLYCFAVSPHLLADNLMPAHMTLDGKSFETRLGPMGEPADVDDLLVFENGQFVSRECERSCGYSKVEYWVRAQADGVQMRADVPCADSGAVMYWRGTVRGNEIEGSFTWVNKRWYWTFEKEFWFEGRLVETNQP